jgi:lipoprotein-releasing system permease protein
MMRFELFAAMRYLRGKRRNRFISLISLISVAGVAVGVMTLIIVMSVMTGFDIALRDTIVGNRAHFTVHAPMSDTIEDYEQVIAEIEALSPDILGSAPVVQIQSLLTATTGYSPGMQEGAYIIGIDPERETKVTYLDENMSSNGGRDYGRGEMPGRKEIVLGYVLASNLRVGIGDKISVLTGKGSITPFGPREGQKLILTVSGISQAQMHDFDALYAWVNLKTARLLTGETGVHGVHCRIKNPDDAETLKMLIEDNTGYRVQTWFENQEAFFMALQQEKFAMFIILIFIVLVAAFNITSTLIMMVMEKKRDIGILRTLGASSNLVLRLFMVEGLFIGIGGTIAGVVAGTLLSFYLNPVAEFLAGLFGIDLFNSQIYYFDRIPVSVVPHDVLYITIVSVILSFLSTLYPAWSASRLNPVDALRHE